MPSRTQILRMGFAGGWATDFGPTAEVGISQSGTVAVPFLTDAENVFFLLDGGTRKIGGIHKIHSSQLESGAEIAGLYDYWADQGDGTWSQHRICHVGTKVYKDDADGTLTEIDSGLTDHAIPCYATMDNLLIYTSDQDQATPKKWDETTVSALGTNTPSFAFMEVHKDRLWAAGDDSNPSTLYYSQHSDDGGPDGNWTTTGAGNLSIDPQDGDRITGLASHKNDLWVFKGPNKGSIHRIVGSAPTGSDGFARIPFLRGVGAINHNSIFRFLDDIGFVGPDGAVHSLRATASFGDFNEASLSRPIHRYFRETLDFSNLHRSWAATVPHEAFVLIGMPSSAASNGFPDTIFLMDYRFIVHATNIEHATQSGARWAKWDAIDCPFGATVKDPTANGRPVVMLGGNDGYIRKTQQPNRNIEDTADAQGSGSLAISARVKTPKMHFGTPFYLKTLALAAVGIAPKGNYDLTLAWQRDNDAEQSATISQAGGSILGSFLLGTDVLGGSGFVDQIVDAVSGGEFRSISFQVSQSVSDQDLEVHTISAGIEGGTNLSTEAA